MFKFGRRNESGAVSLFVVVFAMLLITVVTVSFIRLMLKDQQQASINDLSQSAFDSSQAGVEDAKRALILYRTLCNTGSVGECNTEHDLVNSTTCNEGLKHVAPVPTNNGEVVVQQNQSSNDAALDQAYTCVLMKLETDDYLGTLQANTSKLIPLTTTAPFSEVVIDWYTTDDVGAKNNVVDLLSDASSTLPLLTQSSWPSTRPALMRAQLMQYGSDFTLAGFDNGDGSGSNANTLFLYPTGTTGTQRTVQDTLSFSSDARRVPAGSPQRVRCSGSLTGGGYACSVKLTLPSPIGGNASNRHAYLRLTGMYNNTHFRVTPIATQFDGVQPSIDSTGRANDIYRRVETRVDLVDTNFPFPESAVDLTGNLCKDFLVTDVEYVGGSCTP